MPQRSKKINGGNPLTAKDIKRILLEREISAAQLARQLSGAGVDVTPWRLNAVIHRYPGLVYQEIRELLAEWIGCDVSQIGQDARPRKRMPQPEAEQVQAAA